MDFNAYNSIERSLLITELARGVELAKQLRAQMGPEYSTEIKEMLLQQIETSYDKALFILGSGITSEGPHQLFNVPSLAMPSTPVSAMESPRSDDLHGSLSNHQDAKENSRKRKAASTWTKQVNVNCGSSNEGPPADGYSWRKYGQKDILNAKHSRSYYRCTYRSVQDCWATKQVQRSDDDPTVLHITYKGKHTCDMTHRSKSAPTSPGQQEPKSDDLPISEYQQDSDIILSFQNGMGADVHSSPFSCFNDEIPNIPPSTNICTNKFYASFSPSLISPAASGSSFFSMPPFKMETIDSVQQQQANLEGGDTAAIHSAATSVTNSPTIDPNFSLDPWNFSLNFPFNNQ